MSDKIVSYHLRKASGGTVRVMVDGKIVCQGTTLKVPLVDLLVELVRVGDVSLDEIRRLVEDPGYVPSLTDRLVRREDVRPQPKSRGDSDECAFNFAAEWDIQYFERKYRKLGWAWQVPQM